MCVKEAGPEKVPMAKTQRLTPLKAKADSSELALKVFYSYAHRDEKLRNEVEKHLSPLRRSRQIATWHDRQIMPGADFATEIDRHLASSDIVLLLISSDFLASDYCYRREMQAAIERHLAGLARVIPIILRPCSWQDTPIGQLQALPRDGRPVISWPRRDEALHQVAQGVKRIVVELSASITTRSA